jgi:hypothetical protein
MKAILKYIADKILLKQLEGACLSECPLRFSLSTFVVVVVADRCTMCHIYGGTSCLLFGRSRVQISTLRPEAFYGFLSSSKKILG